MAPNIGLLKAPGNGSFYLTSRAGFLSAEMKIDAGGASSRAFIELTALSSLGKSSFQGPGEGGMEAMSARNVNSSHCEWYGFLLQRE